MSVSKIEAAVLALPEDQRRALVHKLFESLPSESAFGNEGDFLTELDSRDSSPPEAWLDGEQVFAEAKNRPRV